MTTPWLAFYGDDFTGSADVMEVLQWNGLRTVLFLEPPSPQALASFEGIAAFGIAGCSRTMAPEEMDNELRSAMTALKASGAELIHYKTCSTFDSSPAVGSIGLALEIGREVLGKHLVPMVVAAPNLGRYQAFGNLFARSGLDTLPFRLDRHPTMRQHPITPMHEADLRLHLSEQTNLKIALCDLLELNETFDIARCRQTLEPDTAAVLFDAVYASHLPQIGRAIMELAGEQSPLFVVGSSGVEYALTAHWSASGRPPGLQERPAERPTFGATEQLFVLTGSCSPVNDRQIAWAEANGFETLALHTARLIDHQQADSEIERVTELTIQSLRKGASLIVHSSRGPQDARVRETLSAFRAAGMSDLEIRLHSGHMLGPKLGELLRRVLRECPLPRIGVAGGDTSGFVARALGVQALEAIAPVAPGSPLCRVYAEKNLDGREFFFKGGQVGKDDVWGTMLRGSRNRET